MCSVQYGCFYIVPWFRFLLLLKIYSRLLVIRWRSPGKSRNEQEIKAIYSIALRKVWALSIGAIFSALFAYGRPGSNWRFWSNLFLIVPNAPIITGTIFVLTFHIVLTSISRSLYLRNFSVTFMLTLKSSGSGPGSLVSIATGYGLDGPGIEPLWGRDFPHLSRPALGPIQPPVQWISGISRG
jgi:hypothetical protein